MPAFELSHGVFHEFGDIVEGHIKAHRQEKWFYVIALCFIGFMAHKMLDSIVADLLMVLAFAFCGSKILMSKPDLAQSVSHEEIGQLSDSAFDDLGRLKRKLDRAVLLSDLHSIVSATSKKNEAKAKAQEQARSERALQAQQEHALYERKKNGKTERR
ncbi:hypothetical protein [Rugamonas apoptosis]|uniref:Uncharacterized protein n=1 Tax=Rugamonas apoptosis TaxID=2758570 RepID=A0A7W2FEU6_9BURK|nr:hypothetical protein [Rugamonas apoptosis]MBA5690410.1 hypothetical protein [Rugamonas apoptosis]